jgi:molybdate transport system regulatory protein
MRKPKTKTAAKPARRGKAPRRPPGAQPAPTGIQLWIRLTLPGVGLIGPGKIELLRSIQQHESISGAARAMKMSYRRAWLLVEELNGLFEHALVEKWLGGKARGGAKLTPSGENLLKAYDAVVERAKRATRGLLDDLWTDVRQPKRES